MALDSTTIRAACKAAVLAAFDAFNALPSGADTATIQDVVADVMTALVPVLVAAIKETADLHGVSSGSDTVAGPGAIQ